MTLNFTQQQQQRKIPGSTDFNFFPFHLLLLPLLVKNFIAQLSCCCKFSILYFFSACTQHTFYSAASWPSFRVWKRLMRDPKKAVKKRREMEKIQLVLKVRQTSSFKLSEIHTCVCVYHALTAKWERKERFLTLSNRKLWFIKMLSISAVHLVAFFSKAIEEEMEWKKLNTRCVWWHS